MGSCLDLDVLEELIDIMGDDMGMLLNSYFSDSQTKLIELAEMNVQTDQEKIFRMAHALKGSSRNVGVIGFSDLCETIEKQARAESLTENDFALDKLNELYNQAIEELKQRYL